MTKALDLSGNSLIVFAYIFSSILDQFHYACVNLTRISEDYGISYRSVTSNIEKLTSMGLIENRKCDTGIRGCYYVNIKGIAHKCCESGIDYYTDFINSYWTLLSEKFPDDTEAVNNFMRSFIDDSGIYNPDIKALVEVLALKSDSISFSDALKTVTESKESSIDSIKNQPKSVKKVKKKQTTETSVSDGLLITTPEKRKRGRPSKKEELALQKRVITDDFVIMQLGGNEELRDLLHKFLETPNGKKYSVDQWKFQLDNMVTTGITIERMIAGVSKSYMAGYKMLYLAPPFENDMIQKLKRIDEYVRETCNDSDELRGILRNYVLETQKGRTYTLTQFNAALTKLTSVCDTVDAKIESARKSYENSYAALAYEPENKSSYISVVDADDKHNCIIDFINNGYYHLVDGLKELLFTYVDSTQAGASMSFVEFKAALENLREFKLNDGDKLEAIRTAIQTNSRKLATEDYSETRRIKASNESRKSRADHRDRSRESEVFAYSKRYPEDERIIGVKFKTYNKEQRSNVPKYL